MRFMKRLSWDIATYIGFTAIILLTYFEWRGVENSRVYFVSGVAVFLALGLALAFLWRRLALWVTKFFCIVSALDLLAEAFLQPIRDDAGMCYLCQTKFVSIYALYLIVLFPLENWLRTRNAARKK